jgi:hypothetical protein
MATPVRSRRWNIALEKTMRGIVQYINAGQLNGVLGAADGNRYGFTLFDCLPGRRPNIGDIVEFNIEDGVAVEINCGPSVASAGLDLNTLGRSVTLAAGNMVRSVGNRLSNNTPLQPQQTDHGLSGASPFARMANDWRNVFAAVALIACLFPFLSYMQVSTNLFGTMSYAGTGIDSLAQMRNLNQQIYATAGAPLNRRPIVTPNVQQSQEAALTSTAIWALRISYLLVTIPVLAAMTLFAAFKGRSNARPAFWLGVACLSLPAIAVCAGYGLSSLKDQIPMGMGALMPSVTSVLGVGFYFLSAVGLLLILLHRGVIGREPPSAYIAARA